jgi:hypothetical protein
MSRNALEWEQVQTDLQSQVKNVLPVENGGTGEAVGPGALALVAGENMSSYLAVVCVNGIA